LDSFAAPFSLSGVDELHLRSSVIFGSIPWQAQELPSQSRERSAAGGSKVGCVKAEHLMNL
jgi:hypothetical protein